MGKMFKIVPSYPDYEVSADGVVRRRTRARGTRPGRVRATPLDSQGYPTITVGHRPSLPVRVHVLVAEAWIGPIPPGGEVHHKNENRADPRASNLEIKHSRLHHFQEHRTVDRDRRNHGEVNPTVACKCGCGASFLKYDSSNRSREYVSGHNMGKGGGASG